MQFDHRMLGYAVVLATIRQSGWLAVRRGAPERITSGFILMCLALLQATIGGVDAAPRRSDRARPLAHQAGAMVLFAAALYHLWLSLERRGPSGRNQAAASAPSRSAMMSPTSSSPIDSRTTSGPAPARNRASSVSWRCVVEAG